MKNKIIIYLGFISLYFPFQLAKASSPNWVVNANAYQYNMTLTSVATRHCVEIKNPLSKIAAFIGNECRGVAALNLNSGSHNYASLFVYSNKVNGDSIHFKIYDATSDSIYDAELILEFQQNTNKGNAAEPFIIYTDLAPSDLVSSHHKIHENVSNGDEIASFSATDSDSPTNFQFSLTSGNGDDYNHAFQINNNALNVSDALALSGKNLINIRVKVTDISGCSLEKVFMYQVVSKFKLPCSNLVTPNGDGKNDYFFIDDPAFFTGYKLKIFNEAGVNVYTASGDYDNSWEGMYNGNKLPTGAYYYSFQNDLGNEYKGTIQLINNQ